MERDDTPLRLQPPYYAVIFASRRSDGDEGAYQRTAARMVELAAAVPGFLGAESARDARGVGITVSYWRDLDAVKAWKQDSEHRIAQNLGRERWYEWYSLRIAKVERDYVFDHEDQGLTPAAVDSPA